MVAHDLQRMPWGKWKGNYFKDVPKSWYDWFWAKNKSWFRKQSEVPRDMLEAQKYVICEYIVQNWGELLQRKRFPQTQKEIIMSFLKENNWLGLEDEENAGKVVDVYLKIYK